MKKVRPNNHRAWLALSFVLGIILCSCTDDDYSVRRASEATSLYLKGLLEDRTNQTESAIRYYRQAQELERDVPALHFQLGFDYIRLKKFKEAARELEQVLSLAPDDDQARTVLALLYVQLNEIKKSTDQYEILLEKNTQNKSVNVQLRHILSQLYFFEKDFFRARAHCQKILELAPLDDSALFLRAMIESETGLTQKAREGFKEILGRNPDHLDAMNSLAYLDAEENTELDQALELAEKAVMGDPSNGAYLDTLGWIYFKLNETDKALAYLKQASQLLLDPVIFNHVAEAYHRKGMEKEAQEYWRKSLGLDPSQKQINERLQKNSN